MLTQPFTLMISGLIGSRISNEIALAEIRSNLLDFKQQFQGCEIVMSTYEGEVPQQILDLVDKIVYSQDPGPDTLLRRHFLGKNVSPSVYNYSRLLVTTVSGLTACSNRIVFKTRIELIPSKTEVFASTMFEPVEKIASSELPLIGFLTQHYSGVSFCVNGTLGILPDTFQVAKKETLLNTWTLAQSIWLENLKSYKFGIRRYPITCEQILGLSFLSQYCNLDINKLYKKLNRYIFSKKLLDSVLKAEREYFIWLSYRDSGISINYFGGTESIDISRRSTEFNTLVNFRNVCILILRTIKYFIRGLLKDSKISNAQFKVFPCFIL